jgi:tetratricopeptide (TPR) repeat protein
MQMITASSNTTYTYALSTDGELIVTQDAYLPDQYRVDLGLNAPQDLYFDEFDILYIADYDPNGKEDPKIVIYDPSSGLVIDELKHPDFETPTGLSINGNGDLFVADPKAEKIFQFDSDLQFVKEITKPTSTAYTTSQFKPKKIAVDDNENIYVVAEGESNGILQLQTTGEFLGYFAINPVYYSPEERITKFFYDLVNQDYDEIKLPAPFSGVYVDDKGILYSTTSSSAITDRIKKHSTSGSNLFSGIYSRSEGATDIYVDNNGIIFSSSASEGYIDVYTKYGDFIFSFGGTSDDDIIGLYSQLESIAVNSKGDIYTVDSEKTYLLSYKATDYAKGIYEGLNLFEQGKYEESEAKWHEVLMLNQISKLGNNQLAKSYLYQSNYEMAAKHFQIAENREFYSETYWEIRNEWIQRNLGLIIILTVSLVVVYQALKQTNKKFGYLAPITTKFNQFKEIDIVSEFRFVREVIRHPRDGFYEIKKSRKGSLIVATTLLLLLFVAFLTNTAFKGFLFQITDVEDLNIYAIILGYFSIVLIFILSNYLITSINQGEGGLEKIYIQTTYSFVPLIIALLLSTFFTHILTLDESFFVGFTTMVGYIWTFALIFIGITEVQNYEVGDTVKSIILSIVLMAILAITIIFVQLMMTQIFDFVIVFFREVFGIV